MSTSSESSLGSAPSMASPYTRSRMINQPRLPQNPTTGLVSSSTTGQHSRSAATSLETPALVPKIELEGQSTAVASAPAEALAATTVTPTAIATTDPASTAPRTTPRKCDCKADARNLVVCIDGTSNQFSNKNTNIVELYSRLVKDRTQRTFYNSGIGTYATPSWKSWKYYKQVVNHKIDLAIAWNFERILLSAYLWLSENWRPGDRIFLFGFSRGAYQVRALSAMIDAVGLIEKGNQDQIPFAYQLYAETQPVDKIMKDRFKATFSRVVHVHFVGAWDTVSSVGFLRDKNLPGTADGMYHVCYFRHALALHERRVKFLPEYVNGGLGPVVDSPAGPPAQPVEVKAPHTKEVWFPGSHSDIGGGSTQNENMDSFGPSLRWMSFEATRFGLRLDKIPHVWKEHAISKSLSFPWQVLEYLPIPRLSYTGKEATVAWPHRGKPRVIQFGQRLHASAKNSDDSGRAVVSVRTTWSELVKDDYVEKDPYAAVRQIFAASRQVEAGVSALLTSEEVEALDFLIRTEPGKESLRELQIELDTASISLSAMLVSSLEVQLQPEMRTPSLSALAAVRTFMAALEALGARYPPHHLRPAARAIAAVDTTLAREFMVRLSTPESKTLSGDDEELLCVRFLLDGKMLATGGSRGTVRIWNVQTGDFRDCQAKHVGSVFCISGHGWRLASCGQDGTFRVWDVERCLPVLGPIIAHPGQSVHSVVFSRDGRMIATGGEDARVAIWSSYTGMCRSSRSVGNPVHSLAFSSDGGRVLCGNSAGKVLVLDYTQGNAVYEIATGHQLGDCITGLFLTPGDISLVSSSNDATIRITTLGSPTPPQVLRCQGACLDTTLDYSLLVAGSTTGNITLWDLRTGSAVPVNFPAYHAPLTSVCFSPDGQMIALTWKGGKGIALWDATDAWMQYLDKAHPSRVVSRHTALVPDAAPLGNDIVVPMSWEDLKPDPYVATKRILEAVLKAEESSRLITKEEMRALCIITATELGRLTLRGTQVLLQPPVLLVDALLRCLVSNVGGESEVEATNAASPADAARTVFEILRALGERYSPERLRPFARNIASKDETLARELMANFSSPEYRAPLMGHDQEVQSIAFLSDGRLVSSSQDMTLRIWDVSTGRTIFDPLPHHGSALRVAVHGSRIASGSDDGTFCIWDADEGARLLGPIELNETDRNFVGSIAFSRDGAYIATNGSRDRVLLWDAQSGKKIRVLVGHGSPIGCVAFSSDSERLVSGSMDGNLCIWDVASGELSAIRIEGHSTPVMAVHYGRDDEWIFSASRSTMRIWNAQTGQPVRESLRTGYPVSTMAVSQDSTRFALGSFTGKITLYDSETGSAMPIPLRDHTGAAVRSLSFSPDGEVLASTAAGDKTITVWDMTDRWTRYDVV